MSTVAATFPQALLVAADFSHSAVRALDLAVLDAKFAVLARFAPIAATDPIVIIGIDDATLASIPEPVTLSHRMLGEAFRALARAKPRAVGVDDRGPVGRAGQPALAVRGPTACPHAVQGVHRHAPGRRRRRHRARRRRDHEGVRPRGLGAVFRGLRSQGVMSDS